MTLRITLLLMLVSLLGCTTEFQRIQPAQPVAEKPQEEQPYEKVSDANFHLSSWNVNVWPDNSYVRVQRYSDSLES